MSVFIADARAIEYLFDLLDDILRENQEKAAIPPSLKDLTRMAFRD
jgi:hypothetical protein